MFKLKFVFLLFFVCVSSLAYATITGWGSSYWTISDNTITPTSGLSYDVGTVVRYTFSPKTKLVSTTCNISADSSNSASPWAANPVSASVSWGFQSSADVSTDVTVGPGTSQITVTVDGCSGTYPSGTYSFTVTGTAPPPTNKVKITGLPSTYSGNFQTLGGTTGSQVSTPNQTACVYTSKSNGNYYVRIEGLNDSGGTFYMAKGTDKFPVTLEWNGTQLTPGTNKLFTTGNTTSESCSGSTNATLVIKANSADVLKVPGSATQYTDSFEVTVTHPDEI